ncbi:MAG: hypothetical protein ACFCVG_06235 [Kineosporiaceae bacterium]
MPARRRVVMHPSTAHARRSAQLRAVPTVRGIRAHPDAVAALVDRQRRLAVRYAAALAAVLALLPVVPALVDTAPPGWPAGWPAPAWLILPAGALAFCYLLASSHARRATRLERRWLHETGPAVPAAGGPDA